MNNPIDIFPEPKWHSKVSPSIDLSGLNNTLSTVSQGIETIKNTVSTATDTRKKVLNKAQSWYTQAKSASDTINKTLTGMNGGIKDFVEQTVAVVSKGGVIESFTKELSSVFDLAKNSTTEFMKVIDASKILDLAQKHQIQKSINDMLGKVNELQISTLGSIGQALQTPDFIKTIQGTVEEKFKDLNGTIGIFKDQLKTLNIDVAIGPIEAAAVGAMVLTATDQLAFNPETALNMAGDYLKQIQFKMITVSPIVGKLPALKEEVVKSVNGEFANAPADKGYYGAFIFFTTASGTAAALTEWTKRSIAIFGANPNIGSVITQTINNPLVSPLGQMLGDTFNAKVENANIDKDLALPAMLQKFPQETFDDIKNSMDTGFLKDLVKDGSPIAQFFKKEKTTETVNREKFVESKKVSILPQSVTTLATAVVGEKNITDIEGISKDISKLGKSPEDKWIDIKGPEHLFTVTGQQLELTDQILKDITGIVPKLQNSIELVLSKVQKELDSFQDIKLPSFEAAQKEINKIPERLGEVEFDMLILPPKGEGLKSLRMQISEGLSEATADSPHMVGDVAIFAIMVVVSAPTIAMTNIQMAAVAKQFKKN